jgi:hypothetical protein
MTQYKGIFGESAFKVGTNHLRFVEEKALFRSARIAVPIFPNPYIPNDIVANAAGGDAVTVLPDWRPLAPGAGFALPVNGERERFYPAPQVDFSGQNISMAINYALQPDKSMQIMSVESAAFEGELFLCQDPLTMTAGVQVFVGQGVGIGRIVDVLVFDPSLSQ